MVLLFFEIRPNFEVRPKAIVHLTLAWSHPLVVHTTKLSKVAGFETRRFFKHSWFILYTDNEATHSRVEIVIFVL